jgi:hypothetical protein
MKFLKTNRAITMILFVSFLIQFTLATAVQNLPTNSENFKMLFMYKHPSYKIYTASKLNQFTYKNVILGERDIAFYQASFDDGTVNNYYI